MKTNYYFSLLVFMLALAVFPQTVGAVVSITKAPAEYVEIKPELNRKMLEHQLGRKLTLKERVGFFIAKRKMTLDKKRKGLSGKEQGLALVLCLMFGIIGVHRFYLGYTGMGVLYIFTLGLLGIGWLIDTILLIIPNGLTPKGYTRY